MTILPSLPRSIFPNVNNNPSEQSDEFLGLYVVKYGVHVNIYEMYAKRCRPWVLPRSVIPHSTKMCYHNNQQQRKTQIVNNMKLSLWYVVHVVYMWFLIKASSTLHMYLTSGSWPYYPVYFNEWFVWYKFMSSDDQHMYKIVMQLNRFDQYIESNSSKQTHADTDNTKEMDSEDTTLSRPHRYTCTTHTHKHNTPNQDLIDTYIESNLSKHTQRKRYR